MSCWSINQDYQKIKMSVDLLQDCNTQVGNAKHFQRLCSKNYSVKVGIKKISEGTKILLNTKMDKLLKLIKHKRKKTLFNESIETKPWTFNNLRFYDDKINLFTKLGKKRLNRTVS